MLLTKKPGKKLLAAEKSVSVVAVMASWAAWRLMAWRESGIPYVLCAQSKQAALCVWQLDGWLQRCVAVEAAASSDCDYAIHAKVRPLKHLGE